MTRSQASFHREDHPLFFAQKLEDHMQVPGSDSRNPTPPPSGVRTVDLEIGCLTQTLPQKEDL